MSKFFWVVVALLVLMLGVHYVRKHAKPAAAMLPYSGSALAWPLDCYKGEACLNHIGYPDVKKSGNDFKCDPVDIRGHEGSDLSITQSAMEHGVNVFAAAEGTVQWVFDGKYDQCPSDHPDCRMPGGMAPDMNEGGRVCTPLGQYCREGQGQCFWCFDGGNVVVILHDSSTGVFATRYDHLKRGSIRVKPGEHVRQGQVIAQVGSAGHSTGPHLHFEIWKSTFYDPYDPWPGQCNAADKRLWPYPDGGATR